MTDEKKLELSILNSIRETQSEINELEKSRSKTSYIPGPFVLEKAITSEDDEYINFIKEKCENDIEVTQKLSSLYARKSGLLILLKNPDKSIKMLKNIIDSLQKIQEKAEEL